MQSQNRKLTWLEESDLRDMIFEEQEDHDEMMCREYDFLEEQISLFADRYEKDLDELGFHPELPCPECADLYTVKDWVRA